MDTLYTLLYYKIILHTMINQNNEQLIKKFSKTGVLLLLDVPAGLQFGIDNMVWQIGNKFKGIKLIPLGIHIITYALNNQNYLFPIKKFIWFGAQNKYGSDEERIRVFRWSNLSQRFIALKGEQAEGYRQGIKKYYFDAYLGVYPQQTTQFWAANTNHITKQVLEKLDPIQYYQPTQQQYTSSSKQKQQGESADIDSQSEHSQQQQQHDNQPFEQPQQQSPQTPSQPSPLPTTKPQDFPSIYYSEIPRRLCQQAHHTSQINIDRTPILEAVIQNEWAKNGRGVLGEMQYSFVGFLVGQCLESFQQWKKLVILMCSSQKAFDTHKELMLEFIAVFYTQLTQFPQDFFITQLTSSNFLNTCINNLVYYQKQKNMNKKSMARINKFLQLVNSKFIFKKQEIDQEEPVIVEDNQMYF